MNTLPTKETQDTWPKAVIYTHPFSHQKVSKSIPPKEEVPSPTIGWFTKFLFDGKLPEETPFGFSLLLNNTRINYQQCFHNPLLSYLSTDSMNQVLEPQILIGLPGGKGGFGSMLRAQGNRMNSKKASNNDACRDLTGRRLKTVRAAEKLAEYIEGDSERKQAKKAKLIKKITKGLKLPTEQKIRFEDHDYLKECDSLKSGVRGAVLQAVSSSSAKPVVNTNKRTASIFDDDLTDSDEESDSSSGANESADETGSEANETGEEADSGSEAHSSEK